MAVDDVRISNLLTKLNEIEDCLRVVTLANYPAMNANCRSPFSEYVCKLCRGKLMIMHIRKESATPENEEFLQRAESYVQFIENIKRTDIRDFRELTSHFFIGLADVREFNRQMSAMVQYLWGSYYAETL